MARAERDSSGSAGQPAPAKWNVELHVFHFHGAARVKAASAARVSFGPKRERGKDGQRMIRSDGNLASCPFSVGF